MLPVTLRAKLGLLFLAFVILVLVSVGATLWVLESHATDALVINLAGRQRMLTQKMTWLSLSRSDPAELTTSIQLFEQTLPALRDGGPTFDAIGRRVVLPPAPDAELIGQLDGVAETWTVLRAALLNSDEHSLRDNALRILAELDAVVSAFEAHAQAQVKQLQIIQVVALLGALLLLGLGYRFTKTQIVGRLAHLNRAAHQITRGKLTTPILDDGGDEIAGLGRALETMRAEIGATRDHLNARVAQRTRELDAAFETSQALVSELELDTVLHSVAERARLLTHARTASLCLLNQATGALDLQASSGNRVAPRSDGASPARPLALTVLNDGTVLQDAGCATCAFLRAQAPGNCAVAPLRTGKQTLGAFCVVRATAEPFSEEETRALTLLANAAAVAIANARLIETGKAQAEQNAAHAERERLAAELHDNLAQTLGFLNLKTDYARELLAEGRVTETATELERARCAVDSAYGQVRAALIGLREGPTNSQDLAQRLADCVSDLEYEGAPHIELQLESEALRLAPPVQTQVVQIVREALINVRRHAHAQQVVVCGSCTNRDALIKIEDDGSGFDPKMATGGHHLGLTIMRTRAERSGGQLEIDSAPGQGTRIIARFPLAEMKRS